MMKRRLKQKGTVVTEYALLILILLGAILFCQKLLLRGIGGKWHNVGDAYGFGQQYSPITTKDCKFEPRFLSIWYDADCAAAYKCSETDQACITTSASACSAGCN